MVAGIVRDGLSAMRLSVPTRAGESGGRGEGVCQPHKCCAAAPQTRPWQAPMPQRVASLASVQPLQAATEA